MTRQHGADPEPQISTRPGMLETCNDQEPDVLCLGSEHGQSSTKYDAGQQQYTHHNDF